MLTGLALSATRERAGALALRAMQIKRMNMYRAEGLLRNLRACVSVRVCACARVGLWVWDMGWDGMESVGGGG